LEEATHLIQSARQGELEAFNCLVLMYQDLVFWQAIWMLDEPGSAEEVTQQTFLLAYRKPRSFQDGDFACWLLKIASRLCLEELHRRKSGHSSPQKARDHDGIEVDAVFCVNGLLGSPEDNAGQHDLVKIVQESLNGLSSDLRAVITLVDIWEMDYTQTAEILGISVRSVKSRLARARAQLREMLLAPSRL
jgi:RNA polymerase sigma-70 factor (ECF subfamily)